MTTSRLTLRSATRSPSLRLITASLAASTVGTGMWVSIRVIYLARSGLSAAEIGTGLLIAGLLGAAATVPAGRLVDGYSARHGRRDATVVLLAIEGAVAAMFALVHGFIAFLAVASVAAAAERACAAAAATLIAELFGEDKVRCRASMQAAMNAGLCLGGAVAAGALATGSLAALRVIALANGLSYLVACVLTRRLPAVAAPARADRDTARMPAPAPMPVSGRVPVPGRYIAFGCANALLMVHAAMLSVALPLLVAETRLVPAWTIGAAIFINSAAVGLLQPAASRRIADRRAAGWAALRGGVLLAASCALIVALEPVPSGARLVLLALAIAVYTLAELAHAASAIYLSYTLAEGHPLSSCQSVFACTVGISKAVAPLAVTGAVLAGPAGLLGLGAGLLLAGAAVRRCADESSGRRGAQRVAIDDPYVSAAGLQPAGLDVGA